MSKFNFHAPVNANQVGDNNSMEIRGDSNLNMSGFEEIFKQLRVDLEKLSPDKKAQAEMIASELESELKLHAPDKEKTSKWASQLSDIGKGVLTGFISKFLVEIAMNS